MPALYLSLSIPTAIREANQVGTLQPTTLVACEADIGPLLDATDAAALAPFGATPDDLAADDWRVRMREEGAAPTQLLAERLIAQGFAGMRVPSYARGAGAGDLNMVLWRWDGMLRAVDDEGRLR